MTGKRSDTDRDTARLTIENGVERDVNEVTDYQCDECSTDEMEVWHERA